MVALVYGGRPLDQAIHAKDIEVEGDQPALARFLTLFPLPEQANAEE